MEYNYAKKHYHICVSKKHKKLKITKYEIYNAVTFIKTSKSLLFGKEQFKENSSFIF